MHNNMENIGFLLGGMVGYLFVTIALGILIQVIFGLINSIIRFALGKKKITRQKLSLAQDLLLYFLMGFPISFSGYLSGDDGISDEQKGIILLIAIIGCYLIVYKLNKYWRQPVQITESNSITSKTQKERSPNFIKKRLTQLKSINLGLYRLLIILSFGIMFISGVLSDQNNSTEPELVIMAVIISWLLYWILVFIVLWIYDGFKKSD